MNRIVLILSLSFILLFPVLLSAGMAKSRFTTLHYSNPELLKAFNEHLRLGGKLKRNLRKKDILTIEDEVLAKLDTLVEKAEMVLAMFPDQLSINIVLLESGGEVSRVYKEKYGKDADHIAYYSLSEDTIYISVKDTRLRVLAHEIGHAVVDHYFNVRPPYNIHELMAQFTEKHITD